MNSQDLKTLAESLISVFDLAGRESIRLYDQGLKIGDKKG